MDLNAEATNEYEAQFYGFSPLAFSDCVHNMVIGAWRSAIKKCVLTQPEVSLKRVNRSDVGHG